MKCILSNRIWGNRELDQPSIVDACTYKIPLSEYEAMLAKQRGGMSYRVIKTYTRPASDVFSIPTGRIDLIPEGAEVLDKRTNLVLQAFPDFKFQDGLRESQKNCVDFALLHGSCIVRARPGWGKTFTALAIAAKLKQRTLIVVHTKKLAEQWREEIEKALGITPGIIGDSQYALGDYITIGLIKSVYKHRMTIAKSFGLVVVDEVHHLPAEQFIGFINCSYAKHKIGMSGTLERVDKTHVLIFDYISRNVFFAPDENVMAPKVHIIEVPIDFDNIYGANYSAKVTELNNDPMWWSVVAKIVNNYVDMGHKVLCVSDRTLSVNAIASRTGGFPYCYETPAEEKERCFAEMRAGNGTNIVGSQKIFSEGISENYLSCLVLAFSTKGPNLDQLMGRVIRQNPGKPQPIIVDIALQGKVMQRHLRERIEQYENYGYHVTKFKV